MGRNSRERHKAKRKAADASQRRRGLTEPGFDGPVFLRADRPSPAQIVAELIDRAVMAADRQQPAEFARCRDLLVVGPGGAAGMQVVNRELFATLLDEVEQCWQRGWQPAELIRAARREGGARHARLMTDACAGQMREHPAATVGQAWRNQLAGATTWWTHDDRFVNDWAAHHNVDRAEAVATILETVHLLLVMPPVDMIGPMSGAPDEGDSNGELDQRLLDRVRALLAKAEATDFPEEADAYTAKAQELMTRHRIDHALLAAKADKRDRPGSRRIAVDNPYEMPKSLLLQAVAEANSCRAVWMKRFGLVAVVGYAADLDATEVLFTSLLVQATRAMTGAGSKTDRAGRNTTRSFRQSFLTSYAHRIGERLTTASEQVAQETAASTRGAALLPVLAARTDAVNDAVAEQFPEMTHVSTSVNNHDGWASGRAAADRALLHGREELAS
ncbi:DUF2786 domain-containing protein [Actinoplanes solisilvae]|uniref:DUF2786 domain-containing protein n=1 Tax=Actinoplanes solisilvae TaxID=2486853 RepID=UPI000FDBF533|nr:DUF2786 domain-containing protein [Actinoplanes solisilvae]